MTQAVSLQLGCVRLTEKFVPDPAGPFTDELTARIGAHCAAAFRPLRFLRPSIFHRSPPRSAPVEPSPPFAPSLPPSVVCSFEATLTGRGRIHIAHPVARNRRAAPGHASPGAGFATCTGRRFPSRPRHPRRHRRPRKSSPSFRHSPFFNLRYWVWPRKPSFHVVRLARGRANPQRIVTACRASDTGKLSRAT